jgi:hypothetical protein
MDSVRWKQIPELFHFAADLPATEQWAFLKNAAGDNSTLVADVMAMLEGFQ